MMQLINTSFLAQIYRINIIIRKKIFGLIMYSVSKDSVIIIGAGLAGLTAADQILKQNSKAQVTILEAMGQPGGRTRSIQINGAVFDLGAEWIGHPQKYAIELARRAELQTVQQFHSGTKILQFGSSISTYKTNIPRNIGIVPLIHMQTILWRIDKLAKTVPLDNPRNCPNAVQWDSITADTWIKKTIWFDQVRRLFQLSVRAILGCQANQVSFLFFLWYVHQNHGIDCLINVQNGLQCTKFVKGTQALSLYLEKQIKKRDGKIYYNSFVNKVVQGEKSVAVITRDGQEYQASYLIIAAPPPANRSINFQPPLSRERRFIHQRYIMGGYSKMVLLYDKQYWRQKGYSGQILSDCHNGPVLMTYDDTRTKQNGQIQPAIVVFFAASIDEQWTRNKEQCKKNVTEKLASFYKCAQMLNPLNIEMKVWNQEQSIGGAPVAYTPPGVLTKINNIRQPEDRIHWAGTQTAQISQGYMDGAIQSGIRVSKQILQRFQNTWQSPKSLGPTSKWYSQIAVLKKSGILGRMFWWL